ncbi:MAG: hypothetical protein U5K29_10735 [Acidimicrobiales bacterium]|nr:hypothetical protein [Acidimicrobiales bacterium]
MTVPLSDDRRAALVAARTASLARDHLGLEVDAGAFAEFAHHGAAAMVDRHAVIDLGNAPGSGLGAGLVWAVRHGAVSCDLIVDPDAATRRDPGVLARQAQLFAPAPRIWVLAGDQLTEAEPAPHEPPVVPPPDTAEQVLLLRQAGLEVVVEQGEVIGEIRGLEVARVVVHDGGAHLEVGVGRFDREAFGLLHGDLSPPEALARVVDQIRSLRAPGAEPHPVNRLVRERWLRHQIIDAPETVGATRLDAVERPRARGGLRDTAIASALGRRADGEALVVAASVGVDLDAVPDAADTRAWHAPDAHLMLVVPTGDVHPVTRQLVDRLARPAEIVEVDPEWSR